MKQDSQQQKREAGRLPGAPDDGERRQGAGLRAVGAAAARIAAPIVARHGGGVLSRLKAEWTAVAGAEFAAAAWPEALGRDGALTLRVAPQAALELQHRAPLLIERINLFFGRTVATRLALRQGPLPFAPPATRESAPPPLPAGDEEAIGARVADIVDAELRGALARLGQVVLAKAR